MFDVAPEKVPLSSESSIVAEKSDVRGFRPSFLRPCLGTAAGLMSSLESWSNGCCITNSVLSFIDAKPIPQARTANNLTDIDPR